MRLLLAIFILSNILTSAFAGSVDDVSISFSTRGPDRYSDGSIVLDGECYALVWSKDGVFDGFSAGGSCIDEEDKIVLLAPIAKNGHCPSVLFQIPADEAVAMSSGFYAVYLLDTRVESAEGTVATGSNNGKIKLMNGYGLASEKVSIANNTVSSLAGENASNTDGQVASYIPKADSKCVQPKIKSMRIDGENVFLTVENLEGFMRVNSGTSVAAFDEATAAVEANGADNDIILVARKRGNSGFFKVIRSGK
jgi:hypothetical protein